ncbi:peptide MFS transporter [Dyella psychrodurans]|uniref:MFS transporter n=1 Tax=Dyella psychrodurans TaxID=1927960 RepID=A0A370WVC4_9GAMM|nr:peptide MFS transporter [Dyella psychrodurans]RDS80040.1 MFS transporter [Dyella psychrodurans]
MLAAHRNHRLRPFLTVLLFEFWERCGYYGTAVLMVLFMIQQLGIRDTDASLIWGTFSALLFAAPAVGGWVGDRILGAKRSMRLGACVLALGYLLLTISGNSLPKMHLALGLIIVGSGLFKPNIANMVRRVYEDSPSTFDRVFTLYYMTNNIAASVFVLLTPWIKDRWGWHAAFAVCFVCMVIGLICYAYLARTLADMGSTADTQRLRGRSLAGVLGGCGLAVLVAAFVMQHDVMALACVYLGSAAVLGVFGYMIANGKRSERAGLIAAVFLVGEAMLFFVFYNQVGTSLTLFALRHVDWNQTLFGRHLFTWSPAQYAGINSLWVMVLSPPLAWVYRQLEKRGRDLHVAAKFAWGFVAVAAGFFVFGFSGHAAHDGKVSSWFMVAGYGFYSLGELLVAALGLAMMSRFVPARMGGFMMGAFFVAAGIAQYLGSVIANRANLVGGLVDANAGLAAYTRLFDDLGWLAVAGAIVAIALLPFLRRLSDVHERDRIDREKHEAEAEAPRLRAH